jgi:hypothetical protein
MPKRKARERAGEILGPVILRALETAQLEIVYKGEYQALKQTAKKETDPGVIAIYKRYGTLKR